MEVMKRMRPRTFGTGVILGIVFSLCGAAAPLADTPNVGPPSLVVLITRHGVRSPGDPKELMPYSARAWPTWEVGPGKLTPHGASLMRQFGGYYRRLYAGAGLLPASGCPAAGSVFFWADVDERTVDTGKAIAGGMFPACGISVMHASGKEDPLFDPLPALGKADSAISLASVNGSIGGDPNAIIRAYASTYATLDAVLGCSTACTPISKVPTFVAPDPDTGLASVSGGLDAAGTAAENLLLEYADAKPLVGWGLVDDKTVLALMQLHALKSRLEHESYYNARAEGSNILTAIGATLDQGAADQKNPNTLAPPSSRFVAIVGHDTTLSLLAGMLRLSWLMDGYQINDTPPGGALVFELYQPKNAGAFVRLFFNAQSLEQMRTGDGSHPQRVQVYVPGCPSMDCPIGTFDTVLRNAIDPRFVSPWRR
jgi:4-phytase / acid phosphatase